MPALRSLLSKTLLLAAVALGPGLAQAAATASAAGDAGLQGGLVAPVLDVAFTPDLDLFAFDLSVQFESDVLAWQASGSTLTLNSTVYSFSSDVAALSAAGVSFGLDESASPTLTLRISGVPFDPLALTSLRFMPRFQIGASAQPGLAMVAFSGTFTGADLSDFNFARTTNIQISAVPEPTTWLLMLAGLGLVGAAAMRRQPV